MCQWFTEIPKQSRSAGTAKKQNIALFMKPNQGKEFYRFRLLAFKSPNKSNRDFPFIARQIHEHWGKTEKGISVVDDSVTCLLTDFVEYEGNRYKDCPMCKAADSAFVQYKNSGYKDKVSGQRYRDLKRRFQAAVAVYVVDDPNNEKNNGRLCVIIFSEKDQYKKFMTIVNSEIAKAKIKLQKDGSSYNVFNGQNAVDFCVRMDRVPEIYNQGKPNERTVEKNKITKMMFTSTPYDLPVITKDLIDAFPYDETYYVTNTVEEIEAFRKKYFSHPDADIPDEEINMFDAAPVAAPAAPVAKTNAVTSTLGENELKVESELKVPEISDDLFDDLKSDTDDLPAPGAETEPTDDQAGPAAKPEGDIDADLDSLLADLDK